MKNVETFDLLDILGLIKRKQRRYIALLLNDLEESISDPNEYTCARKVVLDYFNDFTRSVFRVLIGEEVEGMSFS